MFFAVLANVGYPLLFALVAGESAGLLLPDETALIVAATLCGASATTASINCPVA